MRQFLNLLTITFIYLINLSLLKIILKFCNCTHFHFMGLTCIDLEYSGNLYDIASTIHKIH